MRRVIITLVLAVVLMLAMVAPVLAGGPAHPGPHGGGGNGDGAPPFNTVTDGEIWIWGKKWWTSDYDLSGSGLLELKEGDTITITVGTVVKWRNKENSPHDVMGMDGVMFESETLRYNDLFSYTWSTLGLGMFHCHKHNKSMAHIKVNAS